MIPSYRRPMILLLLLAAFGLLRHTEAFVSVSERGGGRLVCCTAAADIVQMSAVSSTKSGSELRPQHSNNFEFQESSQMKRFTAGVTSAVTTTTTTTGSSRRAFLTFVSTATTTVVAQTSWAECSCAADDVAMDLMASQKSELIEEIKKDTKDDIKAAKDTDKLISSLKSVVEEVKADKAAAAAAAPKPTVAAVASTPQRGTMTVSSEKMDLAKAMQLIDGETRDLIDLLEQEEEQIAEETVKLMRKVETLEAASERLNKPLLDEPDAKTADEAVAKSQAETYAFLAKLKKRSTEKEGFIEMLKQESTAFASGGKIDLKLPEFVEQLRKTSEADKEFDLSLNAFRERLMRGLRK